MKINCVSCGHKVDLSDAYDDYNGAIKCYVCDALLEIKVEDGALRSVQLCTEMPSAQPYKAKAGSVL